MEKQIKKPKLVDVYPAKEERESPFWFKSEKRVKNVDFHRIENNPNQEVLTPFEMEVKQNLGSVSSPYEELSRIEQEKELANEEHALKIKMGFLACKAKLTPLQRRCYELMYLKKIAPNKARRRLGVSQSRLLQLIRQVEVAFVKAHTGQSFRASRKRTNGDYALTPKQKKVMRLHEEEGQSCEQIALHLGVSRQAVRMIYEGGVKKIFTRGDRLSNL